MKRPLAFVAGAVFLLAAVALGATVAGEATEPDLFWHAVVSDVRSPALVQFAFGFDELGGGLFGVFVVPIAIATLVLILRGWRSAVFTVSAFAISALLVQIMKSLFGRARPEDLLVMADYGSFPSGHTANAMTIMVVLAILFPRVLVFIFGTAWMLLMAFARTVVSAHWLTDTLGGALLGAAAALFVAAAMRPLIERERPHVAPVQHVEPARG